jgi:hypothetical protein
LVDRGTRELSGGHDATIPLCAYHHRGVCRPGMSAVVMRQVYGPSFALHKREAVAEYGTKRELLEIINERLAEKAA